MSGNYAPLETSDGSIPVKTLRRRINQRDTDNDGDNKSKWQEWFLAFYNLLIAALHLTFVIVVAAAPRYKSFRKFGSVRRLSYRLLKPSINSIWAYSGWKIDLYLSLQLFNILTTLFRVVSAVSAFKSVCGKERPSKKATRRAKANSSNNDDNWVGLGVNSLQALR